MQLLKQYNDICHGQSDYHLDHYIATGMLNMIINVRMLSTYCMLTQVFFHTESFKQHYCLIISKAQPHMPQGTLENRHWAGCSTFNINTFVEVLSIRKAILNTP